MFQSHGGMMCLITGALSPLGPLDGWPTHFKLRSYAYVKSDFSRTECDANRESEDRAPLQTPLSRAVTQRSHPYALC